MSRMTHPGPRALIHLRVQAFTDDGELAGGLLAAGWKIRTADDAGAIARLPPDEVPGVGLLDLRGVADADAQALFAQPELVAMLAGHRLEWVALLRPEQRCCAALARLVHVYCRDYVTHPCGAETLSIVLGHALGMARLAMETLLRSRDRSASTGWWATAR